MNIRFNMQRNYCINLSSIYRASFKLASEEFSNFDTANYGSPVSTGFVILIEERELRIQQRKAKTKKNFFTNSYINISDLSKIAEDVLKLRPMKGVILKCLHFLHQIF